MRVAHVITGLEVGGAEMMLHKLLGALDRTAFEQLVISLVSPGGVRARWVESSPMYSVQVWVRAGRAARSSSLVQRAQKISANTSAFARASGPEMMRVPLVLKPSA